MQISTEYVPKMNVSKDADDSFMSALPVEDPRRQEALLARQAGTSAIWRCVPGQEAVVTERCSHCRGGLSFVRYTIINNADAYCSVDCMKKGTIGTPEYDLIASRYFRLDSKEIKPKKNGRPKLRLSAAARKARRNGQYRRANANRSGTTKTPLNPTETKVDAGAIFEKAA